MQEEADIRTVPRKYSDNISLIVHAIGRGRGIGKARKDHLLKNTIVYHEGTRSIRAAEGADDHSILVHIVGERVTRTRKPEVGEFAATEEKSSAVKIVSGAARQKAHDSSVII